MPRYVAFLRGVMPTNANMAELRRCFGGAGFTDVKTVLSSGNVVFGARSSSETAIVRRIEAAMAKDLGRTFHTIVRTSSALEDLIASDPFLGVAVPPDSRKVITFMDEPVKGKLKLPVEIDGARILAATGREAFTIYWPNPKGPVFMSLIEKTFGKNVTTRTWETVKKCSVA